MKQGFLVVLFAFSIGAYAHTSPEFLQKKKKSAFSQGQLTAHLGTGLIVPVNYGDYDYSIYGKNEFKKKLPFNFIADYGITDFLSAGLFVGFYGQDVTITDNTNPNNIYGFNNKFKVFGLEASYHQNIDIDNIDPYATLTIGYNSCKAKSFGTLNYLDPYKGGLAWALHAGAHYYFTDNIGAYLEGGYGKWIPVINLGVAAKF